MPVGAKLLCAGLSDPGRVRKINEDRIHVDADRGIFVVVDGLGGHAAGERAAETAVEMIVARLDRQTGTTEDRIREAITVANNEIHRLASEHVEWEGMACVVTLAIVEEEQLTVGHVGDSRLYLLEPGSIGKLTHDHSPVGEREDSGELSEAAAMAHPRRNEVFRDLGNQEHGPDDPEFIEIVRRPLPLAFAVLLCSDGLSDQVTSADIRSIVERYAGDPEGAVRTLVSEANAAGGKDNVSVLVVESPEYVVAVRRAPGEEAPRRGKGLHALLAFAAGLLLALFAVAVFKPHLTITEDGRRWRLGPVRQPITWRVAASGENPIDRALEHAIRGDTILVAPGTYHENLKLRSGVSLISEQLHGAVLDAPGVVVEAAGVRDAKFAGFRIAGQGEIGIKIFDSAVEILGVEVNGMRDAGVDISGASAGAVRASTITYNEGGGIRISGDARTLISHNVISANGRAASRLRPGLEIVGSAIPELSANTIAENGAEQVWASPLSDVPGILEKNLIAPGVRDRKKAVKVVAR